MLKRYGDVSEYIKKLSSPVRQAVGPDAILLACCILGGQLAKNDDNLRTIGLELKALVWNHLQDLQKIPLSSKINQFARKLSKGLGLLMDFPLCDDRILQTLHSEDVILAALSSLKVNRLMEPESKVEFQLRNCGPYMEKGFDSQPDPRVSNFNPDAWQREVLDVVDDRQSLFVVAPTSAGKTFISFYAMKQVLKESNDGVLVYVAPTKALCNQVAADIQARFNKGYPSMMVGKSVWAIHTRDYRVNTSTNCQVLVTVPQMLQNLLLSPTLSTGGGDNPWTSRIKWIVFDEVHSIGLSEEGVVWEQLLLIAPCPIIALSATVGNPNEFKDWMEGCEQRKGRELKMIIHPARYSDLRCYFWTPQEDFSFTGVAQTNRWPIPGLGPDGYNQDAPFTAIHPVAALLDRSRDSLDDISLESRNCLSLWQSMKRHQSAKYGLDLTLDPDRFFSKPATLKSRAVEWETELKKVMLHWMHNHDSPFLDVQKDFSSALEDNAPTRRYGIERILQLLVDLQKRDALPALIFLYDRTGCKDTVRKIVEQLRKSEVQWKETSPEWQRTLASFKKHQQEIKHLQKKAGKAPKKAKRAKNDGDDDYGPSSKLDALREDASQEGGKWAGFDPENPLEKFSLANYKKLAKSELEEIIKEIKYARLDDYIIEGLRRGVAVHHSGMNRGYLQIVEILFRKGFLSAVIATGTLALGINMPCKTVVFLGDSTFLTALNFRQGAGRAGRRGFDILGNIVFYDFTPHRAKEIMSLRLSDLRGHFPISTSLVLRTATLLHQTDRCEFSQQCLKSLFSQTRIYLGGPEGKDAIKHHLRFSIEYLRRHNLLSANGAPINFAGLISHLHYSEDSVFALHSLLEAGYFHKLCADIHRDEAGVLNNMVLVLSHLFGRIYCRRCKDKEWLENKVRPSSSVVLLPPLPAEAETILRKHNSETLSVFRSYVQTYVQQHLAGQPDDTLPFTHQKIASKNPSDTRSSQSAAELRSPFAALSGHTDKFYSIRELCSTVRAGVFLEESTVPYIGIYPVDTDGMPFNAYIYDFFRHGELKTLVTVNGIKDGDAWYLLQDFSLVLKTIVASIAKFISPSSGAGNELELIDLYDGQDGFEDDEGGVYSPEAIPGPALSEPTATEAEASITKAKAKSKKPKKVEVFDSWEDDKSESDEGEDEKNNEIVTSPGRSIVSLPLRPPAAGGSSAATASSPEQGLKTVLLAFERLHEQFEKKFKRVWA
ncbi:hypothetical protein SEUCBS139899_006228 [Sporothrix eucalyptigena]|uniref:P-loop containing nucleoside triphosphate hydrolase protein n=1 Tax=Sporothrix eucalyptigena TaxID=1812306 RepID=A0ABP0ASE2_9PEZI